VSPVQYNKNNKEDGQRNLHFQSLFPLTPFSDLSLARLQGHPGTIIFLVSLSSGQESWLPLLEPGSRVLAFSKVDPKADSPSVPASYRLPRKQQISASSIPPVPMLRIRAPITLQAKSKWSAQNLLGAQTSVLTAETGKLSQEGLCCQASLPEDCTPTLHTARSPES
jgi:hypothetical protein